jgi:hypothetical protein
MHTSLEIITFQKNFSNVITIRYIIFAILFALFIRFLLCIFKTLAHKKGETDLNEEKGNDAFWTLFLKSFFSNSRLVEVDDYFLPTLIGVSELIIIPILFEGGQINILAGWLGLKALGEWGTKNKRTAYNRFIFGNILSLTFSYILWTIFF